MQDGVKRVRTETEAENVGTTSAAPESTDNGLNEAEAGVPDGIGADGGVDGAAQSSDEMVASSGGSKQRRKPPKRPTVKPAFIVAASESGSVLAKADSMNSDNGGFATPLLPSQIKTPRSQPGKNAGSTAGGTQVPIASAPAAANSPPGVRVPAPNRTQEQGASSSNAQTSTNTSSSSHSNERTTKRSLRSPSPPPPPSGPNPASPASANNQQEESGQPLQSIPPELRSYVLAELAKHKDALTERFLQRERELEERMREREKQLEEQYRQDLVRMLKEKEDEIQAREARAREVLIDTQRKLALKTRKELEQQLHNKRMSIGRVVILHDPMGGVTEMWEEGDQVKEVQRRIAQLNIEREETEAARRRLTSTQRRKHLKERQEKQQQAQVQGGDLVERKSGIIDDETFEAELMGILDDVPATNNQSTKVGPASASNRDTFDYQIAEMDEMYKVRLANIKRDLANLQVQIEELELQKRQLVKTEKLFLDEAASEFTNYPLIHERYLFLDMLGKGGFSEVFRAFDLKELKYVACKIHRLNPAWSEAAKMSYLRHVVRESNIQKELCHPRIVRLIDVFKIDSSTLVTVLDLCEHGDLDVYLKEHDTLGEREARAIIMQVFTGLRYLNEQKQRIIHYDLKPANILFHNGEVKLTDFGLSKLVEEASASIELTSQGAGTHWYLPPECFNTSKTPHITPAVDVWSCGVILYQMVFGKRPFPPGSTTMELFMAQLCQTRKVNLEFPSKPQISELTKDFIRRCLSFNPAERPDILTIFDDPYFRNWK